VPDEPQPGWPHGFAAGADGRRALLVLACLRGITPRALHELAWRVGTAQACEAAIRTGAAGTDGDREHIDRVDPAEVERNLTRCGATLLVHGDQGFPACLNDLLYDPPGWLFVRGRQLREDQMRVAVVGSRRCSSLGREIAHDIGRRLAGAGVGVVSGAASGVDGAAHRGALAAPGPTVAVLGCGIDIAYPGSNAGLIERVAEVGTVISEYPPGLPAEPRNFPARNRIIAALGRALVVVEGAAKSGSRISVDHALDLGRDVFAVPGPVTSPLAETPLQLIRDGATMIRGAEDLLADLAIGELLLQAPPPDLPEEERRCYEALSAPSLPDALERAAGLSIPDVMTALINLELRGLIRSVGGRYERTLGAGA
jgi:DNA processing protein